MWRASSSSSRYRSICESKSEQFMVCLLRGKRIVEALAGAIEARHHRPDRNAGHVSDLFVREPLEVAQDNCLAEGHGKRRDFLFQKMNVFGLQDDFRRRGIVVLWLGNIRRGFVTSRLMQRRVGTIADNREQPRPGVG